MTSDERLVCLMKMKTLCSVSVMVALLFSATLARLLASFGVYTGYVVAVQYCSSRNHWSVLIVPLLMIHGPIRVLITIPLSVRQKIIHDTAL